MDHLSDCRNASKSAALLGGHVAEQLIGHERTALLDELLDVAHEDAVLLILNIVQHDFAFGLADQDALNRFAVRKLSDVGDKLGVDGLRRIEQFVEQLAAVELAGDVRKFRPDMAALLSDSVAVLALSGRSGEKQGLATLDVSLLRKQLGAVDRVAKPPDPLLRHDESLEEIANLGVAMRVGGFDIWSRRCVESGRESSAFSNDKAPDVVESNWLMTAARSAWRCFSVSASLFVPPELPDSLSAQQLVDCRGFVVRRCQAANPIVKNSHTRFIDQFRADVRHSPVPGLRDPEIEHGAKGVAWGDQFCVLNAKTALFRGDAEQLHLAWGNAASQFDVGTAAGAELMAVGAIRVQV